MTIETKIYQALSPLVPDQHVYAQDLPETIDVQTYVTYTQIGGAAVNFLDPTKPSKKNARFQINTWAPSDDAAAALARLIEDAMRLIPATVLEAPVSTSEPDLHLYGRRQDFSCWYDD